MAASRGISLPLTMSITNQRFFASAHRALRHELLAQGRPGSFAIGSAHRQRPMPVTPSGSRTETLKRRFTMNHKALVTLTPNNALCDPKGCGPCQPSFIVLGPAHTRGRGLLSGWTAPLSGHEWLSILQRVYTAPEWRATEWHEWIANLPAPQTTDRILH